ncbi:MAG: amino acid adenylation domain-containing protein [Gammaproteobacteria bacterium]|nr:amino acid adenylation domain-containing protein [Gammaproteobacteria bacterium]
MPDNSDLKNRLKNLSPDQIRRLMPGKNRVEAQSNVRMPRNPEHIYPLSKTQERIWFLATLYPESTQYNIPLAILLRPGQINLDRLSEALNRVVHDNEILRTSFRSTNKTVVQEVHPVLRVEVDFEDISDRSTSADLDASIEAIARDHGSTLFDLSTPPLITVKLLKTGHDRHILLLNLHHLISDGVTNSMLAGDIGSYFSYDNTREVREKKFEYIDYVHWEQLWLKTPAYREQLSFWKNELEDLPELFHFPGNQVARERGSASRQESCSLSEDLHERVVDFCRKEGATPFQFYISCYAMMLSSYSRSRDLVIGTAVANRMQRHFQNTYGVFINSLPLRFQIDTSSSFQALFRQLNQKIAQGLANQQVPFSEIVREINPSRNLNENPLYNIHFSYQHFPQTEEKHEYQRLEVDYRVSKFDINLWINITRKERSLSLSYDSQLISRHRARQMLSHFLLLTQVLIEQPGSVIKDIPCIPEESASVLTGEVSTGSSTPWIKHFEKSCSRFPGVVAMVDELGELTYQALDSRASVLADALGKQGLERGSIVIVRTTRGRNFISAMLACMKCGFTYLPLEKNTPAQRFSQILADSGATVVVSEDELEDVPCLLIDALDFSDTEFSLDAVDVHGDDIAYIIYTSGSSGTPKGVCVPHRALSNYVSAMRTRIGDPEIKSFAHVSSLAADLGNTSIFLSLGFGGKLAMPPAGSLADPVALGEFFRDNPVSALKIVPSHLRALDSHLADILPRKLLVCGGESLDLTLHGRLKAINPKLRVINHYGPTEATIGSLTHEVSGHYDNSVIPIGVPIANTDVMLLDQDLNIVPVGGLGEICLAGQNIASGYLGQKRLNREKFIQNPVSRPSKDTGTGKIYRTGDLAYIDEQGHLVFCGRLDRQSKISGLRFEPEDIENVLKSFGPVNDARVFFSSSDRTSGRLVGALQLNETVTLEEISSQLAGYFPQALIPGLFIIEEIPLTSNGKTDLVQLQSMFLDSAQVAKVSQPRDHIELKLMEIFNEVLGNDLVEPEKQFFDLGGHSLLAISLLAMINNYFNTNFRVAVLFQHGSVKALASLIRTNQDKTLPDTFPYLPLIDRVESAKLIKWVHPAGGNVMCYYPVARQLAAFYRSGAFAALDQSSDDGTSIRDLAAYYSSLCETGGSPVVLAGWSMGALIAHDMAAGFGDSRPQTPLILVDQPAPQPGFRSCMNYEEVLHGYCEKIAIFTGSHISLPEGSKGGLDIGYLHQEFIRAGLMPGDVTPANFKIFLDLLVSHNNMVLDHLPSTYGGPVLLLKASENLVQKSSNAPSNSQLEDYGWRRYCQDLTISDVPGNHITMLNRQHVATTAKCIHDWLSKL